MRRLWAFAFRIAFLCAAGARAETAATSELRVENAGCPEAIVPGLAAGVKLEIEVPDARARPDGAFPDSIAIGCDESAGAHRGHDGGRAGAQSTVDLGALAPEHRARALALAAAELVHAMNGAPVPEAPPATTPPAAPPPVVSRSTAARGADPRRPPRARGPAAGRRSRAMAGQSDGLAAGRPRRASLPAGPVLRAGALDRRLRSGACPCRRRRIAIETVAAAVHLYVGTTVGTPALRGGPGNALGLGARHGRPLAGVDAGRQQPLRGLGRTRAARACRPTAANAASP